MRALLDGKPDLTLKELRQALGLECSLQAIHVVLGKMGLTYRKGLFARPNKTARTSRGHAGAGAAGKAAWIRRGSSSSTSRERKQT